MKACLIALAAVLVSSEALLANTALPHFRTADAKVTVAQSYCRICGDDRTICVIKCNGAGACIQNCDYDYQLCVERACRSRR